MRGFVLGPCFVRKFFVSVLSSFAVILLRKRELVALLCVFDSSLIVAFSGQYYSLVFRLWHIKTFFRIVCPKLGFNLELCIAPKTFCGNKGI